jgi:hypothetical protein
MRALGYPGRGTLTAWVREAFPETRTSLVGRSWHPGYSDEVRQAGVVWQFETYVQVEPCRRRRQ